MLNVNSLSGYQTSFYTGLVCVIPSLLLLAKLWLHLQQVQRTPLPPGPPGRWLLGNVRPGPYAHREFTKLTEEYGPVLSVRYGTQIVCIIGRFQAAMDIMQKQGGDLADRPRNIAANELYSGGMRILLVGVGGLLKKLRKALHTHLQPSVAQQYEPVQMKHAKQYILDILEDPKHHEEHARRYAASVIMTITYGKTTPTSYSDREVQEINRTAIRLGAVLKPGSYTLLNTVPWLRHVPYYLKTLHIQHEEELNLYQRQMSVVKQKMVADKAQPSFAKAILENPAGLSDNQLAYLAGSMFGAGSDTTASAITIVVMAAACFPEEQAKVQDQLDTVIGPDRVPTFDDCDSLPLVTAFYLETFRWRPVSAFGFAHRATKDIFWENYVIPAGATVIGNHWAIGRDPEIYPDPEAFKPGRWLDDKGQLRDDLKFPNFGFGRRVCPGQHVAQRSLYINTALLLWAFNISPDPAAPIDTLAFVDTANSHPLPFSAQFDRRRNNIKQVIESRID